jgi:HK97 family phage portal protein
MGWLTRALSPENPSVPLVPGGWSILGDAFGSGENASGIRITEKGALAISGVLAAVRVLGETMGCFPLDIYQKLAKGKRLATEHPLYSVLHDSPNPQMSAFSFRLAFIAQLALWGNAYAEIQRDGANRVRGLWPLPSDRTKAVRENGVLSYTTTATATGAPRIIAAANILHVPFLSFDGLQGMSPIHLQRQGLGLGSSAERFGASLFARGSRPSGVLQLPAGSTMKPEARTNLKESFQHATSGMNALNVILLDEGVTFNPMTINPVDAQFLETRKFQLEEIARWFRIPPHMLGILERSTKSNIEQQSIEFRMFTMLPLVANCEQEWNRKLFAGTPFYAKFNMDELQRGDFATRTKGYLDLRNCGVLSANNICDMEQWDRIPEDEGGDIRIVPLNMISLEAVKTAQDADAATNTDDETGPGDGDDEDEPTQPEEPAQQILRERYALAYIRLFRDATGRTINRARQDAAAVKKIWLPTLTAMAESISSLNGAKEMRPETHNFLADYTGAIAQRCTAWVKEGADATALAEFNRAYTALSEKV